MALFQHAFWTPSTTTGRASKTLYDLSGVAIVKPSIDSYRDVWLYALALLTGVDLPMAELPPEVAEAAFSLVHYMDVPPKPAAHQPAEVESDSDSEPDLQFPWDEETTPLPKPLAALWLRASDTEQRVAMRPLLEAYGRIAGLPGKPPDNNLLPQHKKRQDTTLRVLSQQVLNVLRILTRRWLKPAD